MINVFVYKDTTDAQNWKWTINNKLIPVLDSEQWEDCLIRKSPIPSMIIPSKNEIVDPFIKAIKSDAMDPEERLKAFKAFINGIRDKISRCLCKNDVICVFIHFGGEQFEEFNERMLNIWDRLDSENKKSFLCCAITRNSSNNTINQKWIIDNALIIPNDIKSIVEVINNCFIVCKKAPPTIFDETINNGNDTDDTFNNTITLPTDINTNSNLKNEEIKKNKDYRMYSQFWLIVVLKILVVFELLIGFSLSWWKIIHGQSLASELGFGIIGLIFVIVQVVIVLAMQGDKSFKD